MTLPKGWTKIPCRKKTFARFCRIKQAMMEAEPDKYDETTSHDAALSWMIDKLREKEVIK